MGPHRRLCQWTGCRRYANLRDLDSSQDFCAACAIAMLYGADDPITRHHEFDGTEYTEALRTRPLLGLLGRPDR
ncbi:hypothetical protein [Kitasatospora sp. NPDC054795]